MMAGRPEIVPRANCVVHTRKNEPVDLVPLRDIRDTPEDRKMYPNDWMSVIYMTQKVYDGLLKRLKPTLWNAVPLLHPNKSLWITLRHLVIGDTIRSSEQGALEGACASILKVFEEELTPLPPNFPVIAAEFEAVWEIPNCLGAIAAKLIKSEHVDQYILTRQGTNKVRAESHLALAVDAKLEIIYSTILSGVVGDTFGHIMDMCNLAQYFNEEPHPCPPPRAPKGSQVKLPYTFVGDHRLGARKWLRVATNDENTENEEIQRAMTPANVTLNVLLSRFGILKLKHPLLSCDVVQCPSVLHNYFMRTNPAYGDLERIMDEYNAEPEAVPVPMKEAMQEALSGDIKEAMQRMKMDENCVRVLQDKSGVPAGYLHHFLSFIGLGKIDKEKLMGLYLGLELSPLYNALSEYAQKLPFPSRKWLQIAKDFKAKLQIPNCAGVIATRNVAVFGEFPGLDLYGVLVIIIDANHRVSYSELVIKNQSVAETVAQILDKEELNLPKDKSLVFIGSEGLKKHRLLRRPGDPGHFTKKQLNRGLMISQKLIDTLVDRFAVMDNSVARQSGVGAPCVNFVLSALHNYLMDNSSVYGEGFGN